MVEAIPLRVAAELPRICLPCEADSLPFRISRCFSGYLAAMRD